MANELALLALVAIAALIAINKTNRAINLLDKYGWPVDNQDTSRLLDQHPDLTKQVAEALVSLIVFVMLVMATVITFLIKP